MDSNIQHEMISVLKALALELGREPTKTEFASRYVGAERKLVKHFGNFSVFLQAAGFKTYDDRRTEKRRRITNEVFTTDLEAHLDRYEPKPLEATRPGSYQRTLLIGDVHFPFANHECLGAIYEFARVHDPEVIVQVGDIFDMFSHAKFPRSQNLFVPRDEQRMAREQAEAMWAELKKAAPNATCYQLYGNHDVRPLKRILEVYPTAEDWIASMLKEMMAFPGVTTLDDARTELMLPGNIMVHHGYLSQLGRHRDYALHNVAVGHSHTGGVVYRQIRGEIIWELNVGYVGDQNAKGLSYTAQRTVPWTNGWGYIDSYGPRFIPFVRRSKPSAP